jgi:hypothetical protein
MDYDKMTKAQLIEKLNEQKHLAQAVQAKDREILKMREDRNKEQERNNEIIKSLKEELREQENRSRSMITKEQFEEETKKVLDDAQEAVDKANLVLDTYSQAMNLINSALVIINKNDKYMSEKIK